MNARTLALITVTAIVGGLAYQPLAPLLATLGSRGTFEVRDVEWKQTERPSLPPLKTTEVTYDGKARIVGTGDLASAHALVLVNLIRSRRVNPSDLPDTSTMWAASFDGGGRVAGQDWAFTCTLADLAGPPPPPRYCVHEPSRPEARFEVIGWIELATPVPSAR